MITTSLQKYLHDTIKDTLKVYDEPCFVKWATGVFTGLPEEKMVSLEQDAYDAIFESVVYSLATDAALYCLEAVFALDEGEVRMREWLASANEVALQAADEAREN